MFLACSMFCMFYPANSQAISIRRNKVDLNRLCNKLGHSNGSFRFKNGWTNWLWDISSPHSILSPAIFVFFKLEELTTFSRLCSCFFLWPVCYSLRSLTHIPILLPPTQTCHTILLAMLFFFFLHRTYYSLNSSCLLICVLEYALYDLELYLFCLLLSSSGSGM